MSNNDLLRLQGTHIPNNQYGVAFLNTTIPLSDPYFQLKQAVLLQNNIQSEEYPYSGPPNGLFVMKGGVPKHVIAYFRVKFWNPLKKTVDGFYKNKQLPSLDPFKRINEENEKEAIKGVVQCIEDALNRYPQSYKEDQTLLSQDNLTKNQRIAIQIRYEEKVILNKARTSVMKATSKLGNNSDLI